VYTYVNMYISIYVYMYMYVPGAANYEVTKEVRIHICLCIDL